jgi:SAM-dependent methyltransferase
VLHTTEGAIQIEISKKGKAFLRHHAGPKIIAPNLAHDRTKALLLPAGEPNPFLEAIGIMTPEGRVRARMQRKFRQINKFLELIIDTADLEGIERCPLQIVDCGCGNAYLTFAIYYYLNSVLKIPTVMTGIDVNAGLLRQRSEAAQRLGWDGMRFETTRIADFQPDGRPAIVVALHACDTATDEALAGAVKWGSELIFAAPCCHHHLQAQMTRRQIPRPYHEILRSSILKERMGDLLTDGLRALLLRMHGYRADVVQFIATEHTPKNLMIRAVKSDRVAGNRAVLEYRELTELWGVRPYLEELLQNTP